jgi:LysM repeat protein
MFVKKIFYIGFLLAWLPVFLMAQQESLVKRSEIIENIDGKQYYMHFIKQGETLFEIARVYDVTVDDIQSHNPGSKSGIKSGQILKIPYKEVKDKSVFQEPKKGDSFLHIVKSKETLYGIARSYNADINEIKSLNPGMGDTVKEGQAIQIPIRYKPEQSFRVDKTGTKKHVVQPGETLYSISKQYHVSVDEIKTVNSAIPENLKVGQELLIPVKDLDVQKPGKTHKVVAGETLYSIARLYNISPDDLRQSNPGISPTLTIGQTLVIPDLSDKKSFFLYTAEKNEKLEDIAVRFKTPYEELVALNPDLIKKVGKGNKVKIPVEGIKDAEQKQDLPQSVTEIQESTSCNAIETHRQITYNVALMLPLFLEDVDSLNNTVAFEGNDILDSPSFKFIQFYEGFMMAVDSMSKAGLKMNLYVYDVDNSSRKINAVLKKPELADMDLIIGPFYSESFKKMADFALANNIWIVNPLSNREEIINGFPNVFKLKPATSFQAEELANFLVVRHPQSNIIIVRQNKYKYQEEVSYIKNYLNSHRSASSAIKNRDLLFILDSLKTDKLLSDNILVTKEQLNRNLSETTFVGNTVKEILVAGDSAGSLWSNLSRLRNNFIIVLSDEKVFCQDFMSRLNKLSDNYKITLFGFPEWSKFTDLNNQYLVNLNTHFLVPSLVNFHDYAIKEWIGNFRKAYSTEPQLNFYAFDGFDAGWYFLNALFRYGKDFERCLGEMDIRLTQTQFNFEQLRGNGFQNTHWNIGKHSDYRFIPATK